VLMLGADVDEMNVDPVDLGDEVRQGVEPRLDLAPVVVGLPVTHEVPQHRERYALAVVVDRLLVRPARGSQTSFEVGEVGFRNVDAERADRLVAFGPGGGEGEQACGPQRGNSDGGGAQKLAARGG